ncbi:hypothetical protein MD484_g6821, partial [Candolleomyces efflorescens]
MGRWTAAQDSKGYFQAYYTQFTTLVVTGTFAGAICFAGLSFVHDVLTGDSLQLRLFPDAAKPSNPLGRPYSTFSFGLMLGALSAALNILAAAIAALNATIASHCLLSTPTEDRCPDFQARVILCLFLQLAGAGGIAAAAMILALNFDTAFMIPLVFLFLGGALVGIYHLVAFIGLGALVEGAKMHPFQCASVLLSSAAFVFDASVPSPYTWFTLMACGTTVAYHITEAFPGLKRRKSIHLGKLAVSLIIATGWASCAILTATVRKFQGKWGLGCRYVILAFTALETVVLTAAGFWDFRISIKERDKAAKIDKDPKSA